MHAISSLRATAEKTASPLARVCRVIANVAASITVVAIVGVAGLLVVVPKATGGSALTVLTSSMTPTIPAGSVVVVRPVAYDSVRIGDVLTFQRTPESPALVTHRVTEIRPTTRPRSLITQGDANEGADDPVAEGAIRGRVWFHVPYLGYAKNFAATPRGMLAFVAVPLLFLIMREPGESRRGAKKAKSTATSPDLQLLTVRLRAPDAANPVIRFVGTAPELERIERAMIVDRDAVLLHRAERLTFRWLDLPMPFVRPDTAEPRVAGITLSAEDTVVFTAGYVPVVLRPEAPGARLAPCAVGRA